MRHVSQKILAAYARFFSPSLFVGWFLIAAVCALAGPFGTLINQPFGWRFLYWAIVIGASLPIAVAARVVWHEVIQAEPLLLEDFLVAVTMTAVFGTLLNALNMWMLGEGDQPAIGKSITYLATFLITSTIIIIENLLRKSVEENGPRLQRQKRDRLLDRIDAADGARLTKVSSDNHHVRITTDDMREYRILMRLRDAVAEIDVEDGFCVHRSHWVARDCIVCVEVVNGKEVVRMKCDSIVPIGPKYRSNLIDAGSIAA